MHAELLPHRVEGARVVAVYDIYPDSARSVGDRFGIPVAESPESIFGDPSIDAVAICTSTDTHVQVMIDAARAGKAIFCEKPISLDTTTVLHDAGGGRLAAPPLLLHRAIHTELPGRMDGVRGCAPAGCTVPGGRDGW